MAGSGINSFVLLCLAGVIHLSGALGKLPHGLVSLCLSDNSITSKGSIVAFVAKYMLSDEQM